MGLISDTEREFLEAIRDDRDDDTHRLIYADWLEEEGDPRAEFVRLKIELHALGKFADPRVTYPLKKRVSDIRLTSLANVQQELMQIGVNRFEYRRGVLDEVSIPARQLAEVLPAALKYAPALSTVNIPDLESVDQIKNIPELTTIDELKTQVPHQSMGIDGVMSFVNRLGELNLRGLELTSHWRHQSSHVSMRLLLLGLTRLGLRKLRARIECSAPIDLDDSFEGLQSIRELDLDGLAFSEQTWAQMAARLSSLEELSSSSFVGNVDFPNRAGLRILHLPNGSESTFLSLAPGSQIHSLSTPVLTAQQFKDFLQLPMPSLRSLRIRVTDRMLKSFANQLMQTEWFQQLHRVEIEGDQLQFGYLNYTPARESRIGFNANRAGSREVVER